MNQFIRGVAQPGSAPRSGRGGRQFESGHPDMINSVLQKITAVTGRNIIILTVILCVCSCRPTEEVGTGRYFFSNESDYDLVVKATYHQAATVICDSCIIPKAVVMLLGYDSDFGHAPNPVEAFHMIRCLQERHPQAGTASAFH